MTALAPHSSASAGRPSTQSVSLRAAQGRGMDIAATCGEASTDLLDRIDALDAERDRRLMLARRISYLGYHDARARACGCHARFAAIALEIEPAQDADRVIDGLVAEVRGAFALIREWARSLCQILTNAQALRAPRTRS